MNELIASIKTNQKLWDADESAMLDICNTLIMQQAEIEALKAHPVKELTDEEIYDVFEKCLFEGGFNKYEFARAILRKAQEK